jgi:hypothetical protein
MLRERGEKMNVYSLLVGKPEGKRPLGRSRNNLVDRRVLYDEDREVYCIGTSGELL